MKARNVNTLLEILETNGLTTDRRIISVIQKQIDDLKGNVNKKCRYHMVSSLVDIRTRKAIDEISNLITLTQNSPKRNRYPYQVI